MINCVTEDHPGSRVEERWEEWENRGRKMS